MLTNMNSLTKEIEEMQDKEFEYSNQIALTEMYQKQFAEAQADYKKYFTYFHSPMDPEIIDERITGMLIIHDMTPASLSFTTLEVEGVPPYFAQELRVNPVPDTTEPTEEEPVAPVPPDGESEDEPYDIAEEPEPEYAVPANNYAFVYTINLSAYGVRDNLYTFLAQVAPMTAMHVISFDFTDPETTRAEDGTTTTTPGEINMQIKMYVLIDGVPASEFGSASQ